MFCFFLDAKFTKPSFDKLVISFRCREQLGDPKMEGLHQVGIQPFEPFERRFRHTSTALFQRRKNPVLLVEITKPLMKTPYVSLGNRKPHQDAMVRNCVFCFSLEIRIPNTGQDWYPMMWLVMIAWQRLHSGRGDSKITSHPTMISLLYFKKPEKITPYFNPSSSKSSDEDGRKKQHIYFEKIW